MQIFPKNKISSAVLLSGGTFEEKYQIILQWIRELLPDAERFKLHHPDIFILPEEENIKNNININIESIRKAISHLQQSAHQGGNKIVVLLKTDSMPIGACNALLKILEEPPAGSYLFLISEYPHLLPATLRSRCQKVILPAQSKTPDQLRLIEELNQTLDSVSREQLSVFQAAEKWRHIDFLVFLDSLYYCLLTPVTLEKVQKKYFFWMDLLNEVRRQVLKKQNPNHLLALENLFYHWKTAK